ncbi:transcriptional regulator [Exiguobacterium sp. SH31]|uniref:arsenite efflux transporter metallochaperone ArsD n=1 Tax=unclassified Exiguobacterium TaxID=2644629 RepID=UPI0008B7EE12|nr:MULTISPECIES: arsenite efflux transporter metallochaperone ArsD [unclassified Exiguobacterium]OGX79927.1 transcriptional regulator [Exiguobacterium sp. SH31]TCI57305.1 arsenite efflux transporter metallochaperone ArsD [Exiguobacterium sp. SH1S21]TCI68166.1 arsenite efflux transporter metallochaperone ArsD [Exiguobacterium sp. SH0S7]
MKLEVFEPAMCCPTGLCGPSIDPELTRIATIHYVLKQRGFDVERYNLASEPNRFVENANVQSEITKGLDTLPLTVIDGEIVKRGAYMTNEEIAELTGLPVTAFAKQDGEKPKVRITLKK